MHDTIEEDEQILKDFKKDFGLDEIVDEATYIKYGKTAWQFFDLRLLATMVVIRESIGKPITINNWNRGLQQRGLRHNRSKMVIKKKGIYLSAHMLGKAFDFDVQGMTAVEVREWLVENQDALPYKIRLENLMRNTPISWVHLDVISNTDNPKVYLFNV